MAAVAENGGDVPLFFAGDYSFINMHGRDMPQKHRETISWHVMHRYEPFKKRRRAELITESGDRETGQVHRANPLRTTAANIL